MRIVNGADGSPISFANLDFGACGQAIAGGNSQVVSDARGVAPEEVYASKRGRESVFRSETELDQVSYSM